MNYADQSEYQVRCEWGLQGMEALHDASELFIIVDVLSFSTCVDIAVSRNATILPFPSRDDTVHAFAKSKNAIVAEKRGVPRAYTLSPESLLEIPAGCRLVLPSPNGSELSVAAPGKHVIAGCLRNAKSIAEYVNRFSSFAVIACGERWKDGSLRPAFEDLLGAGAIISQLNGTKSPEAMLAQAAFEEFEGDLENQIMECSSGKELAERGFTKDIVLASRLNASSAVPELIDGEYRRSFAHSGV